MPEVITGKVFVGCLECGLSWADLDPGEERHTPICSEMDDVFFSDDDG